MQRRTFLAASGALAAASTLPVTSSMFAVIAAGESMVPAGIAPGQVWRAREIADLNAGPLQTDNFEGLAVEPGRDGAVVVWLISDDNSAVTQQTLLWRMELPAPVR